MEKYRFQLEKGSKKHICPKCGKRRFVGFIDTSTGHYLPAIYGRCDREANCNYFLSPYDDNFAVDSFTQDKPNRSDQRQSYTVAGSKPAPTPTQVFIPDEILHATRTRPLSKNVFIDNLATNIPYPFEMDDLKKVVDLFRLGTLAQGYSAGAISFPFIDQQNRVRAIQIKQFDKQNHTINTSFIHANLAHHCTKQKKPLPGWLQAYQQQEKKVTCAFGEHLLRDYPMNPVALTEAPKTAIYGTLYFGFPDESQDNFLWLAVYNLSSLNFEKVKALKGRNVVLFPDLSENGSAFELWSKKAIELEKQIPGTRFLVSDLLEINATPDERKNGQDLADFLIPLDWKEFRKKQNLENTENILFEKSYQLHSQNVDWFCDLSVFDNDSMVEDDQTLYPIREWIRMHVSQVKNENCTTSYEKLCQLQATMLQTNNLSYEKDK
jgi:hypothetical protein